MKSVLVAQRFDLGQLGDLVNQRSRVITGEGLDRSDGKPWACNR